MKFEKSRRFKYDPDTAWRALQMASRLDVEPGSRVEIISDSEWKAYAKGLLGRDFSCTTYRAVFDQENKSVVITGERSGKTKADTIKLTIKDSDEESVLLHLEMEIGFGGNPIAKVIGKMMKSQMKDVITEGVFDSFNDLCREAEYM